MADKNELTIVTDKETEFSSLTQRMDDDRDLRNLSAYKMKTLDGTKDMPGVSNVTLPEPALFISKTIAILSGVQRQPVVEADEKTMKDSDTSFIEGFIEDMEYEIDSYLNQKGEIPAFNFHADIACARGRIAEQIVTRVESGVYIPDVRPLDTRYFTYELGTKGMLWGAVKTWRTKAWIDEEYPEAYFSGKTGIVRDIWNKKENVIYVDDREIKRQPNIYKKPPFTLQIVPAGSVLKDQDNLKYTGESVYEMLRKIFPELNFIASTLKTLNYGLFKPPLSRASKLGEEATPPESYPGDPGSVTSVEMPGAIQPVFTPDIRRFTTLYNQIIKEEADKAGYSLMDFGGLLWPMSEVALARLARGKLELLLPRLQALALLYQARYRMIIEQYLAIGETLKLGELGHRREYPPAKLEGEYTIKFRFFTTHPEEQASLAAIGTALIPFVSEDYIRTDILKLPNPDGEKMKKRAEQAEQMDPAILLYNQCHSLVDVDRDIEAKLVLQRLVSLLRQRRMATTLPQGQEGEPRVPERPEGKQLMPLFAGAGGGRPAPPAEEE